MILNIMTCMVAFIHIVFVYSHFKDKFFGNVNFYSNEQNTGVAEQFMNIFPEHVLFSLTTRWCCGL